MKCISISGQKKYHTECKNLSLCFDLLKNDYSKRLEKYLASPFFIEDNPYLLPLFKTLYSRYLRNTKTVQGSRIINDVYDGDEKKTVARINTDLLLIEQNIYRFLSYQYMQEHPEEEQRLITYSLHNINQPQAFENALKKWQISTDKLKLGFNYSLNHWLQRHLEYYSLDTPKNRKAYALLQDMRTQFNQLAELLNVLYEHEVLSWEQLFKQKKADLPSQNTKNANSPLSSIYRQLLELRKEEGYQPERYHFITSFLKGNAKNIDPLHHLLIWQLAMNYMGNISRNHPHNNSEELLFLVEHYMNHKMYNIFQVVSREIVLNNVKIALMNDKPDLAENIRDAMCPRLPIQNQQLSKTHIEISVAFYKNEHEKVINLLYRHFPRNTMDAYHDGLRLKSYRLRSALYLMATRQDYDEEYELALDDFEHFLHRKKETMAKDQYQYYLPFPRHVGIIFRSLTDEEAKPKLELLDQELANNGSTHANIWIRTFIAELLNKLNKGVRRLI